MALSRYVLTVSALYIIVLGATFIFVTEPVTRPLETLAVTVGGSLTIAWVGTVKAMQILPESPRLLGPSILHGTVLLVVLCALTVECRCSRTALSLRRSGACSSSRLCSQCKRA